jgi:hypothetical protein
MMVAQGFMFFAGIANHLAHFLLMKMKRLIYGTKAMNDLKKVTLSPPGIWRTRFIDKNSGKNIGCGQQWQTCIDNTVVQIEVPLFLDSDIEVELIVERIR